MHKPISIANLGKLDNAHTVIAVVHVHVFVRLCAEVLTGAGGSLAALGGEAALGAATAAHTNPWTLRRNDCAGERGRWRRHPGGVRIHPNTTNTLKFNITPCAFHKHHAGAVVRSVVRVRVHTGQHRLNHEEQKNSQ